MLLCNDMQNRKELFLLCWHVTLTHQWLQLLLQLQTKQLVLVSKSTGAQAAVLSGLHSRSMTAVPIVWCLGLASQLRSAVAGKPLRSDIEAKGPAEACQTGAGCCGSLKQKLKKRLLRGGRGGGWARQWLLARM